MKRKAGSGICPGRLFITSQVLNSGRALTPHHIGDHEQVVHIPSGEIWCSAIAIDPALVPDGTPHRLTFDEFVRLGGLGIYPQQSELVDGIVFDSSPKGDAHYRAQRELLRQLVAHDPQGDRYDAGPEPTLKLDDANGPMPDILVTYANERISNATTALIVEIADSSLAYDRGTKRDRYAKAGIGEYWIVDLRQERVERYLPAGAAEPAVIRSGDALAPAAFPDVTIDIRRLFAKATSRAEEQR